MRFSCKTVNFFNTVINNISTIYSVSGHLNQTSSKSLKKHNRAEKNTPGKKNPFGLKFQPEQLRAEKAACGRPRYIYIYTYTIKLHSLKKRTFISTLLNTRGHLVRFFQCFWPCLMLSCSWKSVVAKAARRAVGKKTMTCDVQGAAIMMHGKKIGDPMLFY